MTLDLTISGAAPPLRIHVLGIGGSGMSAIATILAAMGHTVSGSDLKASPGLERLRALGIRVTVGHDATNLDAPNLFAANLEPVAPDLVAVSTAITERNVELAAARARGIRVVRRAEVLAAICATRRTAAVSGTHGKTTTSSMLALVAVAGGLDPSFLVGGELNEIGGGAAWDDGEWFVVEADESDGTFTALPAEGVIVTNVEADHLDHFGDLAGVIAAFDDFVGAAPGPKVVCADEPNALALARRHGATTYGTHPEADVRITDVSHARAGVTFALVRDDVRLGEVSLPVPGLHNARNATAALVLADAMGVPFAVGRDALARYGGVARRFEFRGEADGITVVDDYAHNPGKVSAVLAAAARGGWGRVVCVFQPHRYSRTAALWRDFGPAFAEADLLVLTDVYAAGEAPVPGVTGKLVVDAVLEATPYKRVAWLPSRRDLVPYLTATVRPGDLVLTVGAGDITGLPDELLAALRARRPAPVGVR